MIVIVWVGIFAEDVFRFERRSWYAKDPFTLVEDICVEGEDFILVPEIDIDKLDVIDVLWAFEAHSKGSRIKTKYPEEVKASLIAKLNV